MGGSFYLSLAVLCFGLALEALVFRVIIKRGQGFGANNMRIVGLTAVITFTTLLVVSGVPNTEPAMAVLGAVAGYLFGFFEKKAAD